MWTQNQVARGRALAKDITPAQWGLGDLAVEAVPTDTPDAEAAIGKFAEEIGVQASTLRTYRQVSIAWPQRTRTSGVAYGLYEELRNDPNRFDELSRFLSSCGTSGHKPTIRRLREFLGRAPKDGGFSSASTVEYNTRKALDDPKTRKAVLDAVAGDDQSVREVTEAYQRRRFAEADARADQGQDQSAARPSNPDHGWAVVQSELSKMVVSANDALRELANLDTGADSDEAERAALLVEKIEHRLGWLRSTLEGGSATLDTELAELLRGE